MRLWLWMTLFLTSLSFAQTTLSSELPSWNDSPNKERIIQFVQQVTNHASKDYVAPEDRIAVFDNDGTLWVEQPLYTQAVFSLQRIKETAKDHPEWKTEKPFSIILSNDPKQFKNLTMQDFAKLMAVSSTGMTVEDYQTIAAHWLNTTENPHFKRHYTKLVYQPMLEAMQYLRNHGFTIYIVTGGGQEFVRAFSKNTYQVDIDKVIGTTIKTSYTNQNNKPSLMKKPEILFVCDKTGKPEAINLFIGKKPIIAFGNSDGDKEMLEWTQSNAKPHAMFLVHHDDAKREYAYGPDTKVGTFSQALMNEAISNHWNVISMEKDWSVIFPE